MRRLILAVVLVLVLVGGAVGGMAVATVGAGSPTLSVSGNTAPGLVIITGTNWSPGVPVDLYMDPIDDPPQASDTAHHVAVATPNLYGRFVKSFLMGPTALGNHEIVAVQGATEVHRSFTITSTSQVDDRIWGALDGIDTEVGNIEGKLDSSDYGLDAIDNEVEGVQSTLGNSTFGLAEIKTEVSDTGSKVDTLQSDVNQIESKLDALGNLVMGPDKDAALLAAGYTQLYPATGYFNLTGNMSWRSMNYLAPEARWGHTAVWTGSEMLVWGGYYYDGTDHFFDSGGRYNPATDTWTDMNTTGAPEGRELHTAVWTGSEMLVWGGINDSGFLNTGARYNPATDTWTDMNTTDAPEGRYFCTAVWTGSEMLVWGGLGSTGLLNSGGCYNPATNTWMAMNITGAPQARAFHTAVWTGTEMLVWGGSGLGADLNSGGCYNPATNTWTTMNTTGAPDARVGHTAVWTGSEMLVWGGMYWNGTQVVYLNTGGRYNLATSAWTTMSTIGAPDAREGQTAVWTGSEMLVWGGEYKNGTLWVYFNTGGRLQAEHYYYYVR